MEFLYTEKKVRGCWVVSSTKSSMSSIPVIINNKNLVVYLKFQLHSY